MFVKLLNPLTKQVLTFQCLGEVYYKTKELPMSRVDQELWRAQSEGQGNDARRFVVWPTDDKDYAVRLCEIIIPGVRGQKGGAVEILTNHHAWLNNDQGRSIDRIHRYDEYDHVVVPPTDKVDAG